VASGGGSHARVSYGCISVGTVRDYMGGLLEPRVVGISDRRNSST